MCPLHGSYDLYEKSGKSSGLVVAFAAHVKAEWWKLLPAPFQTPLHKARSGYEKPKNV